MGKSKGKANAKAKAARTKSRPASSSLAASLLPPGYTSAGFGGYVGGSLVDCSLTSTSGSTNIDAEVTRHLKHISRRDTTTKLKALTSLSVLTRQKTSMEIGAIFPLWAFEYKKLLLDYNKEVRRATHDTMACLVSAAGRDLAPHVKLLIGPWWVSQFDSVYEASQAAQRSFQTAFPAKRRGLDALIVYSGDIFTYIEENLELTPESLLGLATADDELEEMHQQVLSSSLLAVAAVLDVFLSGHSESSASENVTGKSKVAPDVRDTAVLTAKKLCSSHRYFHDFLKSQRPAIRSAAYSVVRSCIKNIPHAMSERHKKGLAGTILGSFKENNPACHAPMWDALILFTKSFPDSWTTANAQKSILRLWNFLRNGCYGSCWKITTIFRYEVQN
ncbi:hypothetical protein CASFOL_025391 [Castilleja foliolosa]|uniref:E3 ubiquitin-protein ligase listerin n=1 Tax=Castilleja foliolosa TaxID=1961234 RepID=A0ABD3CSF8_9LAMI